MAEEKQPTLIDVVYENLEEPESFSFEDFYDVTGLEGDDEIYVEDAVKAFEEKSAEAVFLSEQLAQAELRVGQMKQRQAEGIVIAGIIAFFVGMAAKNR
jgi:hypothetical protein